MKNLGIFCYVILSMGTLPTFAESGNLTDIYCNIRSTGDHLNCGHISDNRPINQTDVFLFVDKVAAEGRSFILKSRIGSERKIEITAQFVAFKELEELVSQGAPSNIIRAMKDKVFTAIEKYAIKKSDELDTLEMQAKR